MKRFTVLLTCLLVTFFITGCFDGGGDDKTNDSGSGKITIKATYNGSLGTDPEATKKIYVYLYKELQDSAKDETNPDYQGSSTEVTSAGDTKTITIEDIAPGDYYIVVFYDYKHHNKNIAGNTDRYVIYESTQYISDATPVEIEEDSDETITLTFDDNFTIQSDGLFMVKPGTVKVNIGYTGAEGDTGDKKLYVYLYTSLSDAQETPVYQGSTSSAVATDGTVNTITINDVAPGDYYLLAFYDYSDNGSFKAGEGDKYILYNNAQYKSESSTLTVLTEQSKSVAISLTDAYSLQGNGAFMLDSSKGILSVNVTFTGTESTAATDKIYLFIFNSAPSKANSAAYASASTSSTIEKNTPYTLSITDIDPGNYYVMVLYDFASGTNIANQTDLYEFYENATKPTSSTLVAVTAGGTKALTISFDDSIVVQSSAAFQ